MRKILASFLAAAMVASIGATMTFAAGTATPNRAAWGQVTTSATTTTASAVPAGYRFAHNTTASLSNTAFEANLDATGAPQPITSSINYRKVSTLETLDIELRDSNGNVLGFLEDIPLANTATVENNGTVDVTDGVAAGAATVAFNRISTQEFGATNIAATLSNLRFYNLQVNGKLYDGRFEVSGSTVSIRFDDAAALPDLTRINLTLKGTNAVSTTQPIVYRDELAGMTAADYAAASDKTLSIQGGTFSIPLVISGSALNPGSGDISSDATETGIFVRDAIISNGEGKPIPLTEKSSGVDNDINDADGVQSDKTVYFMIKEFVGNTNNRTHYEDDNYYKVKVSKGDNAKQVKSVEVVYKNFGSDLYDVINNVQIPGTSGRHRFIKVELNPNYTTDEYKITLDMRITPTSDAVSKNYASSSDELKIKDFSFYMKNIERPADNDWRVGVNGLMLKPLENDWNDVVWYDEDGDVAHMQFFADSAIDSFYSKLSTKWDHADYASYFNDQDAYVFDFTGSPKLSATSRADLEIYTPFVNNDGEITYDGNQAVVYQVIDGDLFEVTDSFEYKEAESGEMAFTTRTRFLGTYIICQRAVEEAADTTTDAPEELTPDTSAPSEVTPDSNAGGGKQPANTGRF